MIQILIAVAIIGAFYYLISHISNGGSKKDTVKETVRGAWRFLRIIFIAFALFILVLYLISLLSGDIIKIF